MAAVRPVVTVYDLKGHKVGQAQTPAVFAAPIRSDIVHTIHTLMAKNRRQPYAVKHMAGMGHSAESWGTGRAVARIPRVAGGGTNRSGQAAFGNMCRKGRMFAPTKIWRKWHRKTAVNQKRYAVASAIAASAVPAIVMARGHSIGALRECPIVVDNSLESVSKTKDAIAVLKAVGAYSDAVRARKSRTIRTGVARMRNRTHTCRRGPLVIYNKDAGLVKAFRNLPGVEISSVHDLNLLTLAPNATLGRFIVWTQGAVEALDEIFGTVNTVAKGKSGFHIPHNVMTIPDLNRVINSTEIQSKLKAKKQATKPAVTKKNPLTNFKAMVALNPYAAQARRIEVEKSLKAAARKVAREEAIRAGKPIVLTGAERRTRAARKASRALSKLNAKRIIHGYVPTAEEVEAAKFNQSVYDKVYAEKTVTPKAAVAKKVCAGFVELQSKIAAATKAREAKAHASFVANKN